MPKIAKKKKKVVNQKEGSKKTAKKTTKLTKTIAPKTATKSVIDKIISQAVKERDYELVVILKPFLPDKILSLIHI